MKFGLMMKLSSLHGDVERAKILLNAGLNSWIDEYSLDTKIVKFLDSFRLGYVVSLKKQIIRKLVDGWPTGYTIEIPDYYPKMLLTIHDLDEDPAEVNNKKRKKN